MTMQLGTTNRINVTLTSFDGSAAVAAIEQDEIIEAGRCEHTIRKRSEKAIESEEAAKLLSEEGNWKNADNKSSFTKYYTDGITGYVLHVTAADNDAEVTINMPTKRVVEHEDVHFEIRRQKLNKNGEAQTVGEIDKYSCRDLRALKQYVKESEAYAAYQNVQWNNDMLSSNIWKRLEDAEGNVIEGIVVSQVESPSE